MLGLLASKRLPEALTVPPAATTMLLLLLLKVSLPVEDTEPPAATKMPLPLTTLRVPVELTAPTTSMRLLLDSSRVPVLATVPPAPRERNAAQMLTGCAPVAARVPPEATVR
jgi:hypothetical protein